MSKYWDMHNLLTYNAMFNFAIGGRGVGKTYNAKVKRTKHFLKTGKQFIYMRRYKTEFADKELFMSDVLDEFPKHEFKIEGMKAYVRKRSKKEKNPNKWECFCFFVTLANTVGKKSVPYPNVDMIVFDEFIIDKGLIHYMPNEVKAFLDFYNTVDRFQDRVRVLFLANAVSLVNPYFITWKLAPRKEKEFHVTHEGYMCTEIIRSDEFRSGVDETRFGKMIKGTSYYDYAVSNVFIDSDESFIEQKPRSARFYFALKFDNKTMGIWVDYSTGNYYISSRSPNNAMVYTLTKDDMQPNLLMLERSNPLIRSVKKLFMAGCVYFDNIETRALFYDVMEYCNI